MYQEFMATLKLAIKILLEDKFVHFCGITYLLVGGLANGGTKQSFKCNFIETFIEWGGENVIFAV